MSKSNIDYTALGIDNIKIEGNTIQATNSNGDIVFNPSGSGKVKIGAQEINSIISYANVANFPASGVSTSYYLASDSSRLYQWTGSYYAEIGPPTAGVNNAQNAANLYLWNNFK